MRTSARFGENNFGFFLKFMECPYGQERLLIQYEHFADNEEEVNFVRTTFMDGPLLRYSRPDLTR